jgi:hypothetical protein
MDCMSEPFVRRVVGRKALGPALLALCVCAGPLFAASTASAATPKITRPGPPTKLMGISGNASEVMSWTAPNSDGGSPITKYVVTAISSSKTKPEKVSCNAASPTTTCTLSGLTNAVTYKATVVAENSKKKSNASEADVIKPGMPGAPTSVVATATSTSASISWSPAPDNGSTITSYTAVATGGATCAYAVTSPGTDTCNLTGLAVYTPYTVCVTATNAAGQGSQGCSQAFQTLPTDLGSTLSAGQDLTVDQALFSPSNTYFAVLQPDGNFVVYPVQQGEDYESSGSALWSTGTFGQPSTSLDMQGDGNLVLYAGGTAIWFTSTPTSPDDSLAMQDDANLVVYNSAAVPQWSRGGGLTGYQGDELPNGFQMNSGMYLYSPSGNYYAVMQPDNNFVVYPAGSSAEWSTGTYGDGATHIEMQPDGNLVIYTAGGTAVWSSGTYGCTGDNLFMQNDGNLVIYSASGTALWSSGGGLIGCGGGGGGGPTAAETGAVNWAISQIGSTSYGSLCLEFVQYAYQDGANLNIEPRTNYGSFNSSTYPQEVWNDGFNTGTTGGSNSTPPYGALVFYNASGPGASDPSDYSHVTIMGSNGNMISTNDVVNENAVHYESMSQVSAKHPYNTYVGWWLPDG